MYDRICNRFRHGCFHILQLLQCRMESCQERGNTDSAECFISDMASILSFISFFIIFTPLYFIHDTDLILQTGDLQQFPDPWVRVDHDRPSAKAGNSGVSAR